MRGERGKQALETQPLAWETALVKVFGYHKRRYGTRRLQMTLRQNRYSGCWERLRTAMRR